MFRLLIAESTHDYITDEGDELAPACQVEAL